MIDGAFASASSTVCPSTPGAPLLRTTFNSARARLASDATSSSSRLLSTTPGPGPLVFLLLALCSRKPRRSDASEGLVVPPAGKHHHHSLDHRLGRLLSRTEAPI